MALGSSSFGTILQNNTENNLFINNTANVENNSNVFNTANATPVETAGSIAWGGFDVCELSTTTEVDYTAYTSAPVETAGSIATAAPIGSFASTAGTVSVASVATASVSSAPSTSCSCSYSC